jgi:ABC-2 type transport system permease protein
VLMGAQLSTNPVGWFGGLLLIAGYGIGFSGLALAVASSTDSSQGYHMMIFMLQLPLLFLSNSLYPLQTLPPWMQIGAYANPTTYIVSGLRQITLDPISSMGTVANIPLWLCFVVIAGFAAFGMNMALRVFKKSIK